MSFIVSLLIGLVVVFYIRRFAFRNTNPAAFLIDIILLAIVTSVVWGALSGSSPPSSNATIERQPQDMAQINRQRLEAEQERIQREREARYEQEQREQERQRQRRQAEQDRRVRYLESIRCGDFSDVGRVCCPIGQRPDNVYTGNWDQPWRYVCVSAN